MQLDKIYTRTGDGGRTSLISGERVRKCDVRIEVVGTVDELNSWFGVLRTYAAASEGQAVRDHAGSALQRIQNDLFNMGSILATKAGREWPGMPEITDTDIGCLESEIDQFQHDLGALSSFVLPGGNPLNAFAHVARTVSRRLERMLWALEESEGVPAEVHAYINRLSDYLFCYARWSAHVAGDPEFLWEPGAHG